LEHKETLAAANKYHKGVEDARKKREILEKKRDTVESFIKPLHEQVELV
jgi:hypothetical protein